jgi:hypothetical protein
MMLHVKPLQLGNHLVIESELPHVMLKSEVEIDVEELSRLLLDQVEYVLVRLLKEVWEEMRAQTDRQVVKDLAVLA